MARLRVTQRGYFIGLTMKRNLSMVSRSTDPREAKIAKTTRPIDEMEQSGKH